MWHDGDGPPEAVQIHVADLAPGDVLFIPAMWFHNMTAQDFGVAVNVFWYVYGKSFVVPNRVT